MTARSRKRATPARKRAPRPVAARRPGKAGALQRRLDAAFAREAATAEILKIIASSPADVQPVFDAIAERAAVLCGAKIGVVTKFDGKLLHLVAFYGASPELVEPIRAIYPLPPGSDTTTARAVRDRAPAQIPDLLADPDYVPKQASLQAGYRSNVAVPLLREGA
jgi:hypothetical protein